MTRTPGREVGAARPGGEVPPADARPDEGPAPDALPGVTAPDGRPAPRRRIAGIDAARGIAVIGMLVVNARFVATGDDVGVVWQIAHGRASLLFVLLAGVGVSFLAHQSRGLSRPGWMTLVWRAVILLPAGLLLDLLGHGAEVILPTYAALFVLAIGLVLLPDRWLAGVAAGVTLLGPVVLLRLHDLRGEAYERDGVSLGRAPVEVLEQLTVFGAYPLVTWTAPFVVGMLIGRLDLRARGVHLRLLLGGAAVAVLAVVVSRLLTRTLGEPTSTAGLDHLVMTTAHSQMPLWLVSGSAAAVAVLGGSLLVADVAGRLMWPLVATGQLALTVYVGHLVVLHFAPEREPVDIGGVAVPLGLLLCVGAVLLASVWRAALAFGPLEAAVRPPWAWAATLDRRG
jgi:uncharacterized membrane protein